MVASRTRQKTSPLGRGAPRPPAGEVSMKDSGRDAGRLTFERCLIPRLLYRRHAFQSRGPPHTFAQRSLPLSDGSVVFCSSAAGSLYTLVADHVVQGRVIFPGAGYLEMARAAAASALHGVYFLQLLAVEAPGLLVECAVSDGRFEVRSSGAPDAVQANTTVHCSGATPGAIAWEHIDHASLRAPSRPSTVGVLYDGFDAVGLQYGPGYRTLTHAWGGASDALARLRARLTREGTQVHPADLDDALCTGAAMGSSGNGETRLPFAVDDALLQGTRRELWAVRTTPCDRSTLTILAC